MTTRSAICLLCGRKFPQARIEDGLFAYWRNGTPDAPVPPRDDAPRDQLSCPACGSTSIYVVHRADDGRLTPGPHATSED